MNSYNSTTNSPKWTKDLNRYFSEDIQIVNKQMKICSTLEKNADQNQNEIPLHTHQGDSYEQTNKQTNKTVPSVEKLQQKMAQLLWKAVQQFFSKKSDIIICVSNSVLTIHPKDLNANTQICAHQWTWQCHSQQPKSGNNPGVH